jgi:hypothetical protein
MVTEDGYQRLKGLKKKRNAFRGGISPSPSSEREYSPLPARHPHNIAEPCRRGRPGFT